MINTIWNISTKMKYNWS